MIRQLSILIPAALAAGALLLNFAIGAGAEEQWHLITTTHDASIASMPAPSAGINFALPDLNGTRMQLSQWQGHPVVLVFWATWCPYCRSQVPALNALYSKYRARGLMVVGVAEDAVRGNGLPAIQQYVAGAGITYPILVGDQATINAYQANTLPTAVFVNSSGQVVDRVEGAAPEDELLERLASIMPR